MTSLSVYHQHTLDLPNKSLTHVEDIVSTLAAVGLQFTQQAVQTPVTAGTPAAEVLKQSAAELKSLQSEHNLLSADVLSLLDERGEGSQLGKDLRREQSTSSDVLYYCLAGRGLLAVHVGEYVYGLLCQKGDALRIPAGVGHWFDGGEHPRYAVARLFASAEPGVFSLHEQDLAATAAAFDDY
ncbi:acireductone dioxygenase [Pseudomonas sp. 5P_3.1_Bac2]|uniref:acireductone dioxygenase n=1 Tax=Pseudomonas sp. 5P_3.1_Bac2 TaxID=2971617 RepID=UPI0021CA7496|nr:acireductone dioxygenase [Pseudomonas sp. 5P_3.1_Bac2]MCU1716211.1 acireductone dioxygenase [Pseudomonas sp. 5P_3.1_Bac2]